MDRKGILRELVSGQNPPVMAIYCSDSRVHDPFRVHPGEIFGLENAGNVFGLCAESRSSLAYAVSHFAVEDRFSVLVLGHTSCGAVTATYECVKRGCDLPHPSLNHLINHIRPAVEGAESLEEAIWRNVRIQMGKVVDFLSGIRPKAKDVYVYGALYYMDERDDISERVLRVKAYSDGRYSPMEEEVTITSRPRMRELLREMGVRRFLE